MKKDMFKRLTAGLVLGSALMVAGCGDDVVTISSYSIEGNKEYVVYDDFSFDGLKLKLKMSDGTTKEIAITESMIEELPDLNTKGEKVLKIKYNDAIYELKFTVGGQTREEMIAKVQAFYQDYLASKKAGDVSMNLNANFTAKAFDDVATFNDNLFPEDLEISEESTKLGEEDFYSIIHALYSNSIKALVKTTAEITTDDIINSNTNTAKLNLTKALINLKSYLSNKDSDNLNGIDYLDYIINDVLFPGASSSYTDTITDYFMQTMIIKESGRNAMKGLVVDNLDHIKHWDSLTNKDGWEGNVYVNYLKAFVEDLNEIVQEYGQEPLVNSAIDSLTTSVLNNPSNTVSEVIYSVVDNVYSQCYYEAPAEPGWYEDTREYYIDEEHADYDVAVQLSRNYFTYLADLVKAMETFIAVETFETEESFKTALNTMTANMKTALDNIISIETSLTEKGWKMYGYDSSVFEDIKEGIELYNAEKSYIDNLVAYMQEYKLIELMLDGCSYGLVSVIDWSNM